MSNTLRIVRDGGGESSSWTEQEALLCCWWLWGMSCFFPFMKN